MSPLFTEFTTLFAVIDPIGSVPVFIAATAALQPEHRRQVAFRAIAYAAAILLFFVVFGQLIIESIGIDLTSFQIAGGIVLFLFAMTMIFGDGKPKHELKDLSACDRKRIAVFPLATPSVASPGAMLAAVTLTNNHDQTILQQAATTGLLGLVLLITLGLFLLANPINRIIGAAGAEIISRVMGIILAALAVDTIIEALRTIASTF